MASRFYVWMKGKAQGVIDGDCEQMGRENAICGYSFDERTTFGWHAETGRLNGSRTHHPIVFCKHTDDASPKLWGAAASGEQFDVRFDFYRVDFEGENSCYYSIELENAAIVEMRMKLEDTNQSVEAYSNETREEVHLSYRRIRWIHHWARVEQVDNWNRH